MLIRIFNSLSHCCLTWSTSILAMTFHYFISPRRPQNVTDMAQGEVARGIQVAGVCLFVVFQL